MEIFDDDDLVSKLCFHRVKDIASDKWWTLIDKQKKLSQLAIQNARGGDEEKVAEAFRNHLDKVPTLVNEVTSLAVWRREILPLLLEKADEELEAKFCVIYMILYHESTIVALLEILLFHSDICKSLEDCAVDLVDYCASQITYLIAKQPEVDTGKEKSPENELICQRDEIRFGVGMRCITIVLYLAENLDKLSLSVTTRIYNTHDFPLLLCNLIESKPWIKEENGQKMQFTDGYWYKKSEGTSAGRHEANTWLALHQLLLQPDLGKYYHLTEYAKGQFMRLESKISGNLLGQLQPLQQLKEGLLYMANFQLPDQKPPIIMELIPEMTNALMQEGAKGWTKIVCQQKKQLVSNMNLTEIAEKLSNTLKGFDAPVNLCTNCSQPAKSRCSKCKKAWYCGRDCQLQHFPYHKKECNPDL
ncbi:zinc finger MYND domain-containing protein 10 [Neocloeon triangulifer]|uniref:zinc finger MYND domain-containing protein 10 n=1 Tax=Neocloeon triangulifer TaxID=2078957 RepID=UPI00286FA383|nr:zinc finger MYND domain-containing protein 10 [Neocloeon triangulifer]